MSEFHSLSPSIDMEVVANTTIPQFLLDQPESRLRPARDPKSAWLVENETGRGYDLAKIKERVYGLANALANKLGVRDNDVVCTFSPNHIDYPIAMWACHRLGAAVSTANPSYTVDELIYQLQASKATVLLCTPLSIKIAQEAASKAGIPRDRVALFSVPGEPLNPKAPFPYIDQLIEWGLKSKTKFKEVVLTNGGAKTKIAFLCFSSGTTGRPKAVAIPHYSVLTNVLQFAAFNKVADPSIPYEKQRFRPGDVSLGVLPFYHIYAIVCLAHVTLFCGQTVIVYSKFDFLDILNGIVKYKMSHLWIVPPMVVLLCKHPAVKKENLKGIRFVMVGAAPLSAELTAQLEDIMPPEAAVGQGYGLTETSTVVCMLPLDLVKSIPGSAGRLITNTVARVVKEDGTLAKVGEPGELVVHLPPTENNRYLNNEEANKEVYIDGWCRTGDQVVIDEDGNLFIVDRLKEVLKVKGFQVAPAELEGTLLGHPSVADAGVVGVPDDYSQEVPAAFVVLQASIAEKAKKSPSEAQKIKDDIYKYVSEKKIRYKWLDGGVHFVEAIPKNASGKILRRVLRDQAKAAGLKGPGHRTKAKL